MEDLKLATLIEDALSCTDYDIAKLMHYLVSHKYVSVKLKLKLWYSFDGKLWRQSEMGPYNEISTTVLQEVQNYKESIEKRLSGGLMITHHEVSNLKCTLERIEKLVSLTKSVKEKESVLKECLYVFYDSDFFKKLDKDKHLICFENGVYDLLQKTLRDPVREDYISLYIEENFDEEDEKIYEKMAKFSAFRDIVVSKRKPKTIWAEDE